MVKLLRLANVNFAVLGKGGAARANGLATRHEYLFVEMAGTLIDTFKCYDVQKVITTCPHCLNTFNKDYPTVTPSSSLRLPPHGLPQRLGPPGAIALDASDAGKVTYHDSCYLARHNGIEDSPRDLLEAAGADLVEMTRNCDEVARRAGWGGGHLGTRVNHNRTWEAAETGATTVAVACPFA